MRNYASFGMMMTALLAAIPLAAQTPDLSGTWLAESNASQKWVLTQKDGKIHVKEMAGDKVEADFTCSLSGEECVAKENGHREKIEMYFNGPKLVEIRERGGQTIKQRLAVSDDGKTLTVEEVPLSSTQKGETRLFHRQST
jgi:hypothetical protein